MTSIEIVEGDRDPNEVSLVSFQDLVATSRKKQRDIRLFVDIETAPNADDDIRPFFVPPKPLPHPGEFDPLKVKYGNTKDPEKRAAKLADDQAKHALACEDWVVQCKQAEEDAWNKFREEATLHPETSRVCAIGYGIQNGDAVDVHLDIDIEKPLLQRFWFLANLCRLYHGVLVTFNGHRFDLPFITARSWVNDLDCEYLLNKYGKMEDFCQDAAERWGMRVYGRHIKLANLARLFGVHGKMEGVTGDMFHVLLNTDPDKAKQYLTSDILALAGVASKMGMV